MHRWAPTWSGPAREATLADVKRAFADPRVLEGAISYYSDVSAGVRLGRISVPGLVVGGTTDIVPAELFSRSGEFFDAPCEVLILDGAATGHIASAPSRSTSVCSHSLPACRTDVQRKRAG